MGNLSRVHFQMFRFIIVVFSIVLMCLGSCTKKPAKACLPPLWWKAEPKTFVTHYFGYGSSRSTAEAQQLAIVDATKAMVRVYEKNFRDRFGEVPTGQVSEALYHVLYYRLHGVRVDKDYQSECGEAYCRVTIARTVVDEQVHERDDIVESIEHILKKRPELIQAKTRGVKKDIERISLRLRQLDDFLTEHRRVLSIGDLVAVFDQVNGHIADLNYAESGTNNNALIKVIKEETTALLVFHEAILLDNPDLSELPPPFLERNPERSIAEKIDHFVEIDRLYARALKNLPSFEQVKRNRMILLADLGDFDPVIQYMQKRQQEKPDELQAKYLERVIASRDAFAEKINDRMTSERINQRSPGTWVKLGYDLEKEGYLGAALRYYEKALFLDPNFEVAYIGKGGILVKLHREEEAKACYRKAAEVNDLSVRANERLGTMLLYEDNPYEASVVLSKALKNDPDDPPSNLAMAIAYRTMAKMKPAFDHFQKALNAAPRRADVHFELAKTYMLVENKEFFVQKHFKKAIELAVANKDPLLPTIELYYREAMERVQ